MMANGGVARRIQSYAFAVSHLRSLPTPHYVVVTFIKMVIAIGGGIWVGVFDLNILSQ